MGVGPDEFKHGVLEHIECIVSATCGDLGHAKGSPLNGFEKLLHGSSSAAWDRVSVDARSYQTLSSRTPFFPSAGTDAQINEEY
jgi:hypothetical protein